MKRIVTAIAAGAPFVCLVALLLAGSPAHAQLPYDITNCNSADFDKVKRAVDDGLRRLTQIETSRADVFQSIYLNAFGQTQSEQVLGFGIFLSIFYNTRALLTGGQTVTFFGGPLPTFPRARFNCDYGSPVDIARYVGNGRVNLYMQILSSLPHTASYGSAQGSWVGTILHESVHILGGGADIRLNGANEDVSAEMLVENRDGRTFTNAENYERFYMSFLF